MKKQFALTRLNRAEKKKVINLMDLLRKNLAVILFLLLSMHAVRLDAQSFTHPGLLHRQTDFDRMKAKVEAGAEPWKSSWDILVANSHSSLTRAYTNPVPSIVYRGFDGTNPENYASLFRDVASAYATALRWKISGDNAYADKSVAIMNAWSATLTSLSGTSDRFLASGIYGYQFANAAEIMRTYDGWAPADFDRFKNMMLTIFYPMNKGFLENHNGACISNYWANWDLANMSSMLGIGVLCDRRDIYNEAVEYFKNGAGNGSIKNMVPYLHGELGQFQESGRDQGHAMLCVALSGSFCEMAWNQGDDLYGYDDNRLLKAYEYIAKYNLGYDVPFTTYTNCIGVIQTVESPDARGNVRPVWEVVYNHYVKRKGLPAPYMSFYAQRVRPEAGGGNYGPNSGGYDQLGYGSLTFAVDEYVRANNQTITFPGIPAKEFDAPDFDPGAGASSGLPVFYSVLDPNVAAVNADGTVHILKPGTTVIYAQQIGNDNFNAAPVEQQTLTVNKIPGTNDGTWSNTGGTLTTAITSTSGNPTLTWLGQTFAVGNQVKFTNVVPAGFTPNTTYYVVFASGATFRLSPTAGGTPITPTSTISNGTGERVPGAATSAVSSVGGSPNLTWPGQTPVVGEHIKLTGTVPGGFTANTTYTIVAASQNTFQLAIKPDGTAINATNTITNGSAQRFQKWLSVANWSGGVLPSGNNATATFGGSSFANIPGVSLDSNITLGTLSYAAGGTSELTLASGLNDGKLTFATSSGMPGINMTLINSGARKLFMGAANNNVRVPLKFAGTQGLKVITPLYGNSGSFAGLRIQAGMNWDEFSGPLILAQGNIELHNTTGNTADADDVLLPKNQRLVLGSEGTALLIFTGSGNAAVRQTIGALDGTDDAYIIAKTSMTARPATLVVGADGQDGNFAGTVGRGPLDTTNHSFYVDLGRVDLVKTGAGTQIVSGVISNGYLVSGSGTATTITGINPSTVTVNDGTLILNGYNLYEGATTVKWGTLTINGSIRSPASVNAGTFSGSGSSSASITVGTGSGIGAIIAPGNGVGEFTSTDTISLNADATYALEFNSGSKIFDKFIAKHVSISNAKLTLTDLGNNSLMGADSYVIIDNRGDDPVNGIFQGLQEGSVFTIGINSFSISYTGGTGNDVILTVLKKQQSIHFGALANKYVGDEDFDPNATASSELAVTYISSNESVATIVNGRIHIVSAGTITITASQAGDSIYLAAGDVTQTLTVNKKTQTLTLAELASKKIGDGDFTLTASASSGLPVTFTSSNPDVATISPTGLVQIKGTGTTSITVLQQGNEVYDEVSATQILTVQGFALKVLHQDGDNGNTINNSIKPYLKIVNEDNTAVPCSQLTIRYWLTAENYAGISAVIDYAQLGNSKVKSKYVALTDPRAGAFGYAEFSFDVTAGTLAAGANSGVIQSRFFNNDYAVFNEADDYSYFNSNTYTANSKITLYRNGHLVWGTEPVAVPGIISLKAVSESKNNGGNTIGTYLKISNEGNVPVPYEDFAIRYWFTTETAAALNYWADYAKIGNSNVVGGFVRLTPALNNADAYLELKVRPTAGSLYPASNTGNIQYRITKADWSDFVQTNDHSYMPPAAFSDNSKITIYYKGGLVWGVEPVANTPLIFAAPAPEAIDLKTLGAGLTLYPNPVVNTLTVLLKKLEPGARVKVFGANGELLQSQQIGSTVQVLSLSRLPAGIYLVEVRNGKFSETRKIIKR